MEDEITVEQLIKEVVSLGERVMVVTELIMDLRKIGKL